MTDDQPGALTIAEACTRLVVRVYEGWELGEADLAPLIEAVRREERERYSELARHFMVAQMRISILLDRMEARDEMDRSAVAARTGRSHQLSLHEGPAWLEAMDEALARLGGPQPAQEPPGGD